MCVQSYQESYHIIRTEQITNPPAITEPPDFYQTLYAMSQNLHFLAAENTRLQCQLSQKQLREEAYTYIKENAGQTYTPGRSGNFQLLMDTTVKAAYKCLKKFPTGCVTFFEIEMNGYRGLFLGEKEYCSSQRLISSLRQMGISINTLCLLWSSFFVTYVAKIK